MFPGRSLVGASMVGSLGVGVSIGESVAGRAGSDSGAGLQVESKTSTKEARSEY